MSDLPRGGVSLLAHGKINLTLAITGRQANGYHTLLGVMQSIGLSNRLTLTALPPGEPRVTLVCDDPLLPTDRRNTAVKAAEAFLQETALSFGLRIDLRKRIPYQAGLGSASADAAGVLAGANALFKEPLSHERLLALAATVGADVPFCLTGGTQRTKGIGELLTPLPALSPCFLVIAKPPEGISTPEAYARFDALKHPLQPDCAALEQALLARELSAVAAACGNAFELCCEIESVAALKAVLLENGAMGAAMSGSGTAVFGIFTEREKAERVIAVLAGQFPTSRFYLTEPADAGILFV